MFTGILEYQKIPDKESFVGRPYYVLLSDFSYSNDYVRKNFTVVCEKGFVTDFASIPEWISFLNPKNGDWKSAAVIHDKACVLARNGKISMREADEYLYYAMRDDGSNVFVSVFFWMWARIFHLINGDR
jgi:hypothetical protein